MPQIKHYYVALSAGAALGFAIVAAIILVARAGFGG